MKIQAKKCLNRHEQRHPQTVGQRRAVGDALSMEDQGILTKCGTTLCKMDHRSTHEFS